MLFADALKLGLRLLLGKGLGLVNLFLRQGGAEQSLALLDSQRSDHMNAIALEDLFQILCGLVSFLGNLDQRHILDLILVEAADVGIKMLVQLAVLFVYQKD